MTLNYQQQNTNSSINSPSPHPSRAATSNTTAQLSWPESSDGGGASSGFASFGSYKVTLDVGGKMFVTLLHTLAKDMHSLLGKVALELSHAAGALSQQQQQQQQRGGGGANRHSSYGGSLSPSTAAATAPPPFTTNFSSLLYAHGIIIDPSTMHVFIDRDPTAFAHILNCLRNMPTPLASTAATSAAVSSSSTSNSHRQTATATTADHHHSLSSPTSSMIVPPIPLDMYEAVLAEARFFRLYDLYARLQEQYAQLRAAGTAGAGTALTSGAPAALQGSATANQQADTNLSSSSHHHHHDLLSTALDELRQLRQAIRDVQLCVTRSYDNGRFWVRA